VEDSESIGTLYKQEALDSKNSFQGILNNIFSFQSLAILY